MAFLKPDVEILAFFENQKNARQNLAFFHRERLASGKTLSEIHIRHKSLLTRVSVKNIAKILLLP